MAQQIFGNPATVLKTLEAFFGFAPSNAVYTNNLAFVDANGASVYARTIASNFSNVSNEVLAGSVLGNLGISSATTNPVAFPALLDALRQAFDAFPTERGQVVLNLVNILSTLESNATYGGVALTFNDTITASAAYSTNAANTVNFDVKPTQDRSFTLTAGLDSGVSFAGGAGNDSYTATDEAHLQSLDTFNGGAGVNSLNIMDVAGFAKVLDDVQFSGVRNIQTLTTTTGTVNLAAAAATAGVNTLNLFDNESLAKTVDLTGFTGALTVNGASSTAADTLTVSLADAGNKTINLGGGLDIVNVTAEAAATAGSTVISFVSGNAGNGTAASVKVDGPNGDLSLDNAGVKIIGNLADQFSVIGTDANGVLVPAQDRGDFRTVILGTSGDDVSTTVGEAGNVYINAGAGNDTLVSVAAGGARHFLVGGAGNDTLNISGDGTTVAIAGGGNDTVLVTGGTGQQNIMLTSGVNIVRFDNGTLVANQADPVAPAVNTNDVVAGGSDLTDTLRATAADLAAVSTNGALVNSVRSISGIEVLGVTTALNNNNLVLANIQTGLNSATLEAGADTVVDATAGTITFTSGGTLSIASGIGGAINVAIAGAGTTDNLTIDNIADAVSAFNAGNIVANGVETLNIRTTGTGAATLQVLGDVTLNGTPTGAPAAPAATTVNVTGSNSVNAGTIFADTLNAAGLTGAANISATTDASNITGSGGDDVLLATTGDLTANLGAGDDRITVNTAGIVNLTGAAGADTFALGATLTSADVIDGGSERDTLEVAGGAYVDNIFNQITNVETLSAGAGSNVTFNAIANARAFDTVNLNAGANFLTLGEGFARALTVNLLNGNDSVQVNPASATVLTVNVGADNLTGADAINAVAGRANVLNVTAVNGANAQLGTVAGIQTLNIVDAGAAMMVNPQVATSITLGANAALTTVNGAGVNDSLVINAGLSAATAITTGSGNDTVNAANTAATIVTGAGGDTVVGGTAIDTVNLGAGNDLVTGNGAADSLTGGTGADLFRYVALADSAGTFVDTITDFVGGVAGAADTNTGDRIQISTALLGGALNFAGNQTSFGAAQGAINAGGDIDYVFQTDTNTLWVDINNDGTLNGNDLQIKLTGVTAIANGDVVSVI